MRDSRSFFDDQAADYRTLGIGNEASNSVAARKIETGIRGSVLSVGGLWDQASLPVGVRVTAADLSREMLHAFAEPGMTLVQCEAGALPFANASMDHAVLPLVLHHLANGSGWDARRRVRRTLEQLHDIVRPGGTIWINEICVQSAIYALELVAAPLTSRVLSLVGQPLVVMHSLSFYGTALREAGWTDIVAEPIVAPDARPFDLVVPVLGMPWLRIPRFAYPIRPTLIHARRSPT
jgi:SAM-dependent methyltransferase